MKVTNVYRDRHRTAAQKARENETRRLFQDWKPGPEELLASGKWEGPVLVEGAEEFWKVIRQARACRERQGLTLKHVSERCGIDVATLSKLENGRQANPTLFTMLLYVGALGQRLGFSIRPRRRPAVQTTEARDPEAAANGKGQPTRRQRRRGKARSAARGEG
jgi:transcriptional regulator with XRE-family HTH domain